MVTQAAAFSQSDPRGRVSRGYIVYSRLGSARIPPGGDVKEARISTEMGVVFLVGRLAIAYFFVVVSGWGHLKRGATMVSYAKSIRYPLASLAGAPAGLWLVAAGVSVGAGIWADLGSLMLALFVVLAGLGFHRFWTVEDPVQRQTQTQLFYRNVTLAFGKGMPFTITDPLFHFAGTP